MRTDWRQVAKFAYLVLRALLSPVRATPANVAGAESESLPGSPGTTGGVRQ